MKESETRMLTSTEEKMMQNFLVGVGYARQGRQTSREKPSLRRT